MKIKYRTEYEVTEQGERSKISKKEFNREGREILSEEYSNSEEFTTKAEYTYVKDQIKTEKIWSDPDHFTVHEYLYNEDGLLIRANTIYMDGSMDYEIHSIKDGKEYIERFVDDEVTTKDVYEKDDQGNPIEIQSYEGGELVKETSNVYNEKNELSESKVHYVKAGRTFEHFYQRDEENNTILYEVVDENEDLVFLREEFYKDDLLIKIDYEDYQNGEKKYTKEYTYNDDNKLIRLAEKDEDGQVTSQQDFDRNEHGDLVGISGITEEGGTAQVNRVIELEYFTED